MATVQDIITTARNLYNDTVVTYRALDAELLGYFNDGLKEIAALQPAVYTKIGDLTCTVGTCEQSVTFVEAMAVIDVLCIHDGAALTPFDMATMNAFNPGWRTDTAGAAVQYCKAEGLPLTFFIYPKAPATAQIIDIKYVRIPTIHAITDTITEIPAYMLPALSQYIVAKAESKDDEHSNSGRATAAYQLFVGMVKGA